MAAALAAATAASAAGGDDPALATVTVASGLDLPVFVTHAPDDHARLFIVEKPGRIRVLNRRTGAIAATPLLDLADLTAGGTNVNSEQGLLGLAFDPGHAANGRMYVFHTDTTGAAVIARYTRAAGAAAADPASRTVLVAVDQPAANHNGGWLGFSPRDGFLYASIGDGGFGNNPGNTAQDTASLLGSILRLDVAGPGATAPPDNPFVGAPGADEIWAYGVRNPWRCGFDPLTGDLYVADVGQGSREEVTVLPAGDPGGANLGWRCREGDWCTGLGGCTCGDPELTEPVHVYRHDAPPAPAPFVCAIVGGAPYRGCAIPGLDGHYLFADFCGGAIWSFKVVDGVATAHADRTSALTTTLGGETVDEVVAFGAGPRGELYVVDQGSGADGAIHRIVDPARGLAADLDLDCSGAVDVMDLVTVILGWGPCDGCLEDVTGDGTVGIDDLVELIEHWG